MKTPLSALRSPAALAAVLICATPPAQAQTSSQLGQLFKTEMTDCSSAPPLNFTLLPEGHRCEIQQRSSDGSFSVSLKSWIPCGCDMRNASFRILRFSIRGNDLTCVAGGPAQITLTSKEQTRTVFVAASEIAFLRADNKGHVTCRTARWRDPSELLANFEWPEAQPATK
jgi:hypothetical protein